MMFILNNRILPLDTQFEHDGIQYPSNWLRFASQADRERIGITEREEQQRPDDRFYWVSDNNDGTFSTIPKDVSQVKAIFISQIKDTANKLLQPSDWQIIRKIERDIDVDTDIATYRAAVITTCADLELEINECSTIADLQGIVFNWPSVS